MLRLTPFTYSRPSSVDHAIELLQTDPSATLMGGGTDLLPNIKHRLAEPTSVIGLKSLPEMLGIRQDESDRMVIGAGETLARIASDPCVRERYPALASAALLISTPQVQQQATIGGNLCLDVRCNYYNQSEHWRQAIGFCMKKDSEICRVAPGGDRCWAVSSADTVPVLIALEADVQVTNSRGSRWVPLRGLYQDDGLIPLTIARGEIVTAVRIPAPSIRLVYEKYRIRQSFDFPLVGAATGIQLDDDGIVRKAKVVLTAVGSYPIEVNGAEQMLLGNRLTPEVIAAAGEKVFRTAHPMDNTEGSIAHRKRLARVYVERALRNFSASASTSSDC